MDPRLKLDEVHVTKDLTPDQKERRKLAKRIVKAIQPALEEAIRKEAELGGKPYEKELKELDNLLDRSMLLRRNSTAASAGEGGSDDDSVEQKGSAALIEKQLIKTQEEPERRSPNVQSEQATVSTPQEDVFRETTPSFTPAAEPEHANTSAITPKLETSGKATTVKEVEVTDGLSQRGLSERVNSEELTCKSSMKVVHENATGNKSHDVSITLPHLSLRRTEASPSPTTNKEDLLAPLSQGGIPWYMEAFDPVGTIIQEERWTGREVVRGMSEELSEIDDEELRGLVDEEMAEAGQINETGNLDPATAQMAGPARRGRGRRGKAVRRWRGFR